MRDAEKTIGNLIDKQTTSYLGSLDGDGFPNVKAFLVPRKREGIHVFYFTANTSSRHTAQFLLDSRACLYFCDKRFFRGVMLRGTVEVLEDASSRAIIWREGDTRYYPQGVDGPDYCVLKFTVRDARYYSNYKSEDFPLGPPIEENTRGAKEPFSME